MGDQKQKSWTEFMKSSLCLRCAHKLIMRKKQRRNDEKMNIQIFGTTKCFDTKKALRYFKERSISCQFIDMKEKGMSKGEYQNVKQAV